jgi:hypothetical protein
MAESELYRKAYAALGSDRAAWDEAAGRISTAPVSKPRNEDGPDVLANIRDEQQLSDDPDRAEPALLVALLLALSQVRWPTSAVAFKERYERTVRGWRLKGRPLLQRPAQVYRYINGPGIFLAVVAAFREADLDDLAEELTEACERAADAADPLTWDGVLALLQDRRLWDAIPRDSVRMSRSSSSFLTFDAGQPVERSDAAWMHAALGLSLPRDACLLELRYATRPPDRIRFPTVADAGWYRWYRGAGSGEPHGWTNPHALVQHSPLRQPEAVQRTPNMDRLAGPQDIRLVLQSDGRRAHN